MFGSSRPVCQENLEEGSLSTFGGFEARVFIISNGHIFVSGFGDIEFMKTLGVKIKNPKKLV